MKLFWKEFKQEFITDFFKEIKKSFAKYGWACYLGGYMAVKGVYPWGNEFWVTLLIMFIFVTMAKKEYKNGTGSNVQGYSKE